MFYEDSEIYELLRCPCCQNKYEDPRLIECGSSFCMTCIEFLTKEGTNGFQCPVCDTFHQQPPNGYLKNTTLAKLCAKKANKVYRSPLANAFEAQLEELKLNMDKLAKENDLGADKIGEYCDELRNKVQLHLEESTESLKNQSLELIQKIDEYEKETKLKFDAKYCHRLDTFLSETRQFHEKWADYLKQFEINEEELNLASNEAKNLENKVNKESDLLLSNLFHSNLLEFKKSTPVFGILFNDGVKQSYFKALNNLRACDLSTKLDYTNISKVSFKLLSNGNLCMAYRQHNDDILRLGIWDHNLKQLFQVTSKYIYNYGFHLVELNQAVILWLFDDAAKSSSITKFNSNLRFQNSIGVGFAIMHAESYQDKLYLLATNRDQNSKHIYVYDESFKLLEKIQLGNREGLPFCVPISVTKMRVAEKYFVFLDGTNVLLVDRLDGAIKRSISNGSSDFVLDSRNDRIMAYDGKTEKLVCFDFEGESFEISWAKLKNFELLDFVHDKFIFFNESTRCIIFNSA